MINLIKICPNFEYFLGRSSNVHKYEIMMTIYIHTSAILNLFCTKSIPQLALKKVDKIVLV